MRSKIVRTIFKKEIIDIIRDKKTLFMGIVLPLILYPLLMIIMTQIMTISMNSIENDDKLFANFITDLKNMTNNSKRKVAICGRINNRNKFSVEYHYTLYDKTKKFFSVFSRLEKPMNIAEYISIVYLYVVGVLFMFCPVRLIRIMGGILLVLATYYLILLRKSSKKPSFIKKFIKKMKKMGFDEINDINDLIYYPQMTLKETEEIS